MNKVTLMGRLTKDVDLRQSQSGTAFGSFTIAVNRKFTKEGEEKKTDFLNCKGFGKTIENISKFFNKGSMIAITGRVETGSYQNKEGQTVYTTDVMVEEFFFTGEKRGEQGQQQPQQQASGFEPVDDGELPF